MTTTIKFSLMLDSYPARTIEDIQKHFSIKDMLKHYNSGMLQHWLKVCGYDTKTKLVEKIDDQGDDSSIVRELIRIFDVEIDDEAIEEKMMILSYEKYEKFKNVMYAQDGFNIDSIIEDYHHSYMELIEHMIANKNNIAILNADVRIMEKKYSKLFALNYYELYYSLLETAPKAIFVILKRDNLRKYWVGKGANRKIYENIKSLLGSSTKMKEILGDDMSILNDDINKWLFH